MATDHIKSDIDSYLSGELPESRRRDVDLHLASCDKCRHAISKVRSKHARLNREALKKAYPDRVPNLLLARLNKEAGLSRRPRRIPWGWLGAGVLLATLAGIGIRYKLRLPVSRTILPLHDSVASTTTVQSLVPVPEVQNSSTSLQTAPLTNASAEASVRQWTDADSAIHDIRKVVIRGRAAWRALWVEMGQPEESAPSMNFNQWIVVGVFAGETTPGTRITLSSPTEEDDQVVLTYQLVPAASSDAAGTVSHPYVLKAIPQNSKPVRLVPTS